MRGPAGIHSYLRDIDDSTIRRIVIVGTSEGDSPVIPDERGNIPDSFDGPWSPKAKTEAFDPERSNGETAPFHTIAEDVEYIRSGESLRVMGLWEFCSYNAPRPPQPTPSIGMPPGAGDMRENL